MSHLIEKKKLFVTEVKHHREDLYEARMAYLVDKSQEMNNFVNTLNENKLNFADLRAS